MRQAPREDAKKSRRASKSVVPAKAETQEDSLKRLDSRFRGNDGSRLREGRARSFRAAWPAVAALLGLALVMPMTSPAFAQYGAIAWDKETGKYGSSWNQDTQKRADEVALGECGTTGCKVIVRTRRAMCAALATNESGKYAGGASRKDRDEARFAALKNCQKGKAGECSIKVTDCNK